MSSPHNFSDDPNAFDGPQQQTSNATMILIAIAVVGGTLFLICGGVIVGGVMMARQVRQDFEVVVEDLENAETAPFYTPADQSQYNAYVRKGRYAEAVEECDRLLEQYPDDAVLHNNKGWLLATCPDEAVRDGELAIEHATQACELTDWGNPYFVDTLAAAYAEAEDFEQAAKTQQEAIDLKPSIAVANGFQSRLVLYQTEQPYREGVRPQRSPVQPVDQPVQPVDEVEEVFDEEVAGSLEDDSSNESEVEVREGSEPDANAVEQDEDRNPFE